MSQPVQHNPQARSVPASCSKWKNLACPELLTPPQNSWREVSRVPLCPRSAYWGLFHYSLGHAPAESCSREHLASGTMSPWLALSLIPSSPTSLLPINQKPELLWHRSSQALCKSSTLIHFSNHPLPPKSFRYIFLSVISKHSYYGFDFVPLFTQLHLVKS